MIVQEKLKNYYSVISVYDRKADVVIKQFSGKLQNVPDPSKYFLANTSFVKITVKKKTLWPKYLFHFFAKI